MLSMSYPSVQSLQEHLPLQVVNHLHQQSHHHHNLQPLGHHLNFGNTKLHAGRSWLINQQAKWQKSHLFIIIKNKFPLPKPGSSFATPSSSSGLTTMDFNSSISSSTASWDWKKRKKLNDLFWNQTNLLKHNYSLRHCPSSRFSLGTL